MEFSPLFEDKNEKAQRNKNQVLNKSSLIQIEPNKTVIHHKKAEQAIASN